MIDWQIFAKVATHIVTIFITLWANRQFENRNRPKLLTYLGHYSPFRFQDHQGNAGAFHTHSIIIRNVGRRAATNVRI